MSETQAGSRRMYLAIGGGILLAPLLTTLHMNRRAPSDAPQPRPAAPDARPEAASSDPAEGWMPTATHKPIRHNYAAGGRKAQRGLILHVQEGEGSLYGRFSDAKVKSSAHFWVSRDGAVEQYVSVHDRAWTQGDGNNEWVSVETSGFASKPLTSEQINAVARIFAWGAREHGWPLAATDSTKGRGLGTHAMGGGDWGWHDCPGPIRSGQREAIIERAG